MLLMLLPNIRHLTIQNKFADQIPIWFWRIIERIVTANRSDTFGSSNLSKLQHFTFANNDDLELTFDALSLFAMLPSMRSLEGHSINGSRLGRPPRYLQYTRPSTFPMRFSSITRLSLTQSSVDAESLQPLLAGISNLQDFEYHHRDRLSRTLYQPHRIVNLLIQYAGTSLVRLNISADPSWSLGVRGEVQSIGSLLGLTAVKYVRADDSLFQKPNADSEDAMSRLVDILPKSTRILHLIHNWSVAKILGLFGGLEALNEERLPALRHLICERSRDLLTDNFKEAMEAIGITCTYLHRG